MVSNSLQVDEPALIAALQRIRTEHGADPDYAEIRSALPAEWPM